MDDSRRRRLHALRITESYAASPDSIPDIQFDPHVQTTVGDERVVHAQQQYRGVSLYPSSFAFHIDDGRVERRTGDELVSIENVDIIPEIPARDAVTAAFRHVRNGSSGPCELTHAPLFAMRRYRPRLIAAFPMPPRPTVFSRGPFSDAVTANLILFSRRNPPVLAWLVTLSVERVVEFTIIVAATEGEEEPILYCVAEAASVAADVYLLNPAEGGPSRVNFPRNLQDYPASIRPATAFSNWVAKWS